MAFDYSEKFEALPKALVALQAALPNPKRDGKNPHFKSKFLTLDELSLAVKPVLAKHGFAVTQTFDGVFDDDRVYLITTLLHESGEWISSTLAMPTVKKNDPQAVGSSITYARRYALASILGVVSDEDDDGNTAAAPPSAPPASKPKSIDEIAGKQYLDRIVEVSKSVWGDPEFRERLKEVIRSHRVHNWGKCPADVARSIMATVESARSDGEATLLPPEPRNEAPNYYKD